MTLDRLRQGFEQLAIVAHLASEFAAQAFGRKLYRRERVLDLVRDATRNIGPGARALRLHEFGDIVESDDGTDVALPFPLVGNPDREGPLFVADLFLDLVLALVLQALLIDGAKDRRELGNDLGQMLADDVHALKAEQALGSAAQKCDAVVAVETDDAGGNAR